MEELKFSDLRSTTRTLIIKITEKINPIVAFNLLPIKLIQNEPRKKLKAIRYPGNILSMRYREVWRGYVKHERRGFFKHMLSIDLSTTTNNINMKLSGGTIQMCGASSEENAIEGASILLGFINKIRQLQLSKNQDDPYFAAMKLEHKDKFDTFMSEFKKSPLIAENEVFVKDDAIKTVMINYNFSVGIKINRISFVKLFTMIDDFRTYYYNQINSFIKIIYNNPSSTKVVFIIYKTGSVTLSGSREEDIKMAFTSFMEHMKYYSMYCASKEEVKSSIPNFDRLMIDF